VPRVLPTGGAQRAAIISSGSTEIIAGSRYLFFFFSCVWFIVSFPYDFVLVVFIIFLAKLYSSQIVKATLYERRFSYSSSAALILSGSYVAAEFTVIE